MTLVSEIFDEDSLLYGYGYGKRADDVEELLSSSVSSQTRVACGFSYHIGDQPRPIEQHSSGNAMGFEMSTLKTY
jgi:hypothetical protein